MGKESPESERLRQTEHLASDVPTANRAQNSALQRNTQSPHALQPEREDGVKLTQRIRGGKVTGLRRRGLVNHKTGFAELGRESGFEPSPGVNIKVRGDSDSEEIHWRVGQKSQYTRMLIG